MPQQNYKSFKTIYTERDLGLERGKQNRARCKSIMNYSTC